MPVVILVAIVLFMIPASAIAQRRGSFDSSPPAGIAVGALPMKGDNPPAGIAVPTPLPRIAPARAPGHEVPRRTISPRFGPASEGWPRDSRTAWSDELRHRRPTGVPHPQIGLPLPSIGMQPISNWNRGARHYGARSYAAWYGWPVIYTVPPIVDSYQQSIASAPPPVAEAVPETGRLILDVQPRTAQVFVDGYYAGTPDDFSADRGGLLLEAGPHRIDLIMADHEQVTFDVRIAPNQFITYRQVLKPIKVEPVPAPAARSAPSIFYLIPGCYMGNVPPKEAKLQPTCDPARAITFQQ